MTIQIGKLATSPIGKIFVAANHKNVISIGLVDTRSKFLAEIGISKREVNQNTLPEDNPIIYQSLRQLKQYLDGERRVFDLPVDWSGMSGFQFTVLKETYNIPFGQVITYGEIARRIGNPNAARAVGRVEAKNPLPILIPCHRVIGADGKLHGYGGRGGIHTKAWLLHHEGVLLDAS
jgi:methylated-DNA-[protein]-cysteine S-methyltransferase